MSVLDWLGFGPKARAYIVIYGQIYEGGYHLVAERSARSHNAKGWMKVTKREMRSYIEMEVEASQASLEKLITELRKGTALSQISKVEVEWRDFKGTLSDFRLRS